MASWLAVVSAIVGAVVVRIAADDLRETISWLRKRIVRAAKKRLPIEVRDRFSEEWEADLSDKPGEVARLLWAIGCYFSTSEIGALVKFGATRTFSINFVERVISRVINLLLTPILILLLVPVFLLFAYLVRQSGPIFESVERVGRYGKRFGLLKYRTDKPASCGGADLTPVGLYLKRNSMDALPCLFNVVLGHMALVGPRPRSQDELARLRADYKEIYLRIRPGLISPLILLDTIEEQDAEDFEFEYILQATPLSYLRIASRAVFSIAVGRPNSLQH